ncbi:MAG: integrin alpha [Planctomycetota bacterium]
MRFLCPFLILISIRSSALAGLPEEELCLYPALSLKAPIFTSGRGVSFAPVDDVDRDGIVDFVFGFPSAEEGECGRVGLFSGRTLVPIRQWQVDSECERFGGCVNGGGDVDGDGVNDVVVGSAAFRGGRGRAFVYSGRSGDLLYANGVAGEHSFFGEAAGHRFGFAAVILGDVNGDGNAEVAISAPDWTNPAGGTERGRVYVYPGYDSKSPIPKAPLYVLTGPSPSLRFGTGLAAIPDFDGDEIPDLAIAATTAIGSVVAGAVRVVSGVDGSTIGEISGENSAQNFAHAIADAGDFNRDGLSDVIIGAPGSPRLNVPGRVAILFGRRPEEKPNEPRFLRIDDVAADLFGSAVCSIGDRNDDGTVDYAVGAPGTPLSATGRGRAGRVDFVSGRDGSTLASMSGARSGSEFGVRLERFPDLDLDGQSEVATGNNAFRSALRVLSLGARPKGSDCDLCRGASPLTLGETVPVPTLAARPLHCYAANVKPGSSVLVDLLPSGDGDAYSVSVEWDGFDRSAGAATFSQFGNPGERVQVFVPRAPSSEATIRVHRTVNGNETGDASLLVSQTEGTVLRSLYPPVAGRSKDEASRFELRAAIVGAGFADGTTFLVTNGKSVFEGDNRLLFVGTAEVLFVMPDAPPGDYDLVAMRDGKEESRLVGALELRESKGSVLQVSLRGTETYRELTREGLVLEYKNRGDAAISAPLFRLRSTDPDSEMGFRLPEDEQFQSQLLVLGASQIGPPDLLAPGEVGRQVIVYGSLRLCSEHPDYPDCPLDIAVDILLPDQSVPIEWTGIGAPDEIVDPNTWSRYLSPVSVEFGRTWLDYRTELAQASVEVQRNGGNPASADKAFRAGVRSSLLGAVEQVAGVVNDRSGIGIPGVEVIASDAGLAVSRVTANRTRTPPTDSS